MNAYRYSTAVSKFQKTGKILIALGCLIVLAGSGLHLIAGYPVISAALAISNLDVDLKKALRAVFLLTGFSWIAIAVVTLVVTFAKTQRSKPVALLCGFALLVQIPVWVGVMSWFVGNEMFAVAAFLLVCGGLFFRDQRSVTS